jgi:hypothetical protein
MSRRLPHAIPGATVIFDTEFKILNATHATWYLQIQCRNQAVDATTCPHVLEDDIGHLPKDGT